MRYEGSQFVRIEDLKGRALEVAKQKGYTKGLAILRVSINSPPEYDVQLVESNDPLDLIVEIGKQDGITPEKIDKALKAFSEEDE